MKPEWWPKNPYEGKALVYWQQEARVIQREHWDEGCQAMAKAMIERLEALSEGEYDFPFLVGNDEWEKLKREIGL